VNHFLISPISCSSLLNFFISVWVLLGMAGCGSEPATAATPAPPAREKIVKSLVGHGFSKGADEDHYVHTGLALAAFLDVECDFGLSLKFTAAVRPDEQIAAVKSLLAELYPSAVPQYFADQITGLSDNALKAGMPLNAPMLETSGFTIAMGNPYYARWTVLVAVFNAGGVYEQPR
jgi:hypothetical protein